MNAVLEFVKTHKAQIIHYGSVVVGAIAGVVVAAIASNQIENVVAVVEETPIAE